MPFPHAITNSVVIVIGDRYFHSFKNGRVQTAWSLSGAKHYQPFREFFHDDFVKLSLRKKNPSLCYVGLMLQSLTFK